VSAETPSISRRCGSCGGELSRYNPDRLCSSCSGAAVGPDIADLQLMRRATVGREVDDAGMVLRAWRATMGENQSEVARRLGMTQQNLSEIESGRHPISLDLRRRAVVQLGVAPEDLGLSAGAGDPPPRTLRWRPVSRRTERRWLNRHRSDLARLAVQLYPEDCRIPQTPLIAGSDWVPPVPLAAGTRRAAASRHSRRR
jgi:transcriptional regulator with XRE-family HTH domain